MRTKITPFFYVLLCLLITGTQACKKETTDDGGGGTNQKTLDKSKMAPKKWYSEGSAFIHDLQSGGVYGSMGGTWQWKNNSDTLEIVIQSGYPQTYWKVYWNNDTMMECEKIGTFAKLPYKTHAW